MKLKQRSKTGSWNANATRKAPALPAD